MSALASEAEAVVGALRERAWRVALAESCTGGLVAGALTAVPRASECLWGGLVVYTPQSKVRLAGLNPEEIEGTRVVSAATTRRLAVAVRGISGAELGAAVTGWAGPDAPGDVVLGTVFLAVSGPAGVDEEHHVFEGDRGAVRAAAAGRLLRRIRFAVAEAQAP